MPLQPARGHLSPTSERYQAWMQVFGTTFVELESPIPILAQLPVIGVQHVYLLKLSALTDEQRDRLVAFLSQKFNRPFVEVREDLERDGCPILAEDVYVSFDMRCVV